VVVKLGFNKSLDVQYGNGRRFAESYDRGAGMFWSHSRGQGHIAYGDEADGMLMEKLGMVLRDVLAECRLLWRSPYTHDTSKSAHIIKFQLSASFCFLVGYICHGLSTPFKSVSAVPVGYTQLRLPSPHICKRQRFYYFNKSYHFRRSITIGTTTTTVIPMKQAKPSN